MKHAIVYTLCLSLLILPPIGAASEKPLYKLYWRERNGEIVIGSVCDNYRYGSIDYRGCRAQAKRHFELQCKAYKRQEENSGGALQRRYRNKRERFCRAASQFGAVN